MVFLSRIGQGWGWRFRSAGPLMVFIMTIMMTRAAAQEDPTTSTDGGLFLEGTLGVMTPDQMTLLELDSIQFQEAVASTALTILMEMSNFTGLEVIRPMTNHNVSVDSTTGDLHVRCQQYWNEVPIEGGSLVVHMDGKTGSVYALNGEVFQLRAVNATEETTVNDLDCELAVEIALMEYGVTNGTWESPCEEAAVIDGDGTPQLAFKRMIGFERLREPFQHDMVFASRRTGELLQVHHKTYGAFSTSTYDCNNGYGNNCDLITSSSKKVSSRDAAVNAAHNFMIDTYNFFLDQFGRDSLNNNGVSVNSHVHVGKNYNNAYYYAGDVYYGDGDGKFFAFRRCGIFSLLLSTVSVNTDSFISCSKYSQIFLLLPDTSGREFTFFCRGLDVVAHECKILISCVMVLR
jgi:Zn-dependent metalloprotease